jgi:hypothetical protein
MQNVSKVEGIIYNIKQPLYKPCVFQEVEAPRFPDNRHMKVVRLSVLRTSRLYPPVNIPGTHLLEATSTPGP